MRTPAKRSSTRRSRRDGSIAALATTKRRNANRTTPLSANSAIKAVFLIGEMKSENAPEKEFDYEEQARREYRRSCDDEAAERHPNNSLSAYFAIKAVFFN